jgi:helix-turn-helix protein
MFQKEVVSDMDLQPRWLRVKAACAYSGISRAKLYPMLAEGLIKSVSVVSAGRKRGFRVIDRYSIDEFLSKLGNKQNKAHIS